ncbi:MAG: hypothetical protein LBF97_05180 [Elusimicrobiota bacterium]|jgi:Skp family chaperone for outer membrane proteins|nr:hypothetical protein [Elusimicrobiota bacterium]
MLLLWKRRKWVYPPPPQGAKDIQRDGLSKHDLEKEKLQLQIEELKHKLNKAKREQQLKEAKLLVDTRHKSEIQRIQQEKLDFQKEKQRKKTNGKILSVVFSILFLIIGTIVAVSIIKCQG